MAQRKHKVRKEKTTIYGVARYVAFTVNDLQWNCHTFHSQTTGIQCITTAPSFNRSGKDGSQHGGGKVLLARKGLLAVFRPMMLPNRSDYPIRSENTAKPLSYWQKSGEKI
jgi:hypothetical protein